MKVKIFSVRANNNFRAIRVGDKTGKSSANEYLEQEIQRFLDENPKAQIKNIQFNTVAIIPHNASWDTTNTEIKWEMEKSVLVLYEE